VKRLIGDDPFQTAVFVLKRTHLGDVADFHPAEPGFPRIPRKIFGPGVAVGAPPVGSGAFDVTCRRARSICPRSRVESARLPRYRARNGARGLQTPFALVARRGFSSLAYLAEGMRCEATVAVMRGCAGPLIVRSLSELSPRMFLGPLRELRARSRCGDDVTIAPATDGAAAAA
jgi:hypothetical protein